MPPIAARARTVAWLWPFMFVLGLVTAVALWVLLALLSGRQLGWLSILVALDLTLMLRLGTLGPGRLRVGLVLGGTVLGIALSNWMIASTWIGGSMGLGPWDAALRMGPQLAWTLLGLANGAWEWVGWVLGLVVGWRAAR